MHKPSWQPFCPPLNKRLPIWTWKHRKNCKCSPGHSSVSQKSLKGLSKASAPQYFSSSYTNISSSASRPDTKYFPLHLPPPNVFQKYTSSSFSCLFPLNLRPKMENCGKPLHLFTLFSHSSFSASLFISVPNPSVSISLMNRFFSTSSFSNFVLLFRFFDRPNTFLLFLLSFFFILYGPYISSLTLPGVRVLIRQKDLVLAKLN